MLTTLTNFLGDREVSAIAPNDLTRYFAYLRSDYIPRRQSNNRHATFREHPAKPLESDPALFPLGEEELGLEIQARCQAETPAQQSK